MAKIKFVEGVQCSQCGDIAYNRHTGAEISILTSEICQHCGAHIINMDRQNRKYDVTKDGIAVIVRVTEGFFSDTCKVVRKI